MTLVSLVVVPGFVFFTHKVGKIRRRLSRTTQELMADMSVITEETLSVSGVLHAKVFDRQRDAVQRYRTSSRRLAELKVRQQMVGRTFLGLSQTFFMLTPAAVYVVAGLTPREPWRRRRAGDGGNDRRLHRAPGAPLLSGPGDAPDLARHAVLPRPLRARLRVPGPSPGPGGGPRTRSRSTSAGGQGRSGCAGVYLPLRRATVPGAAIPPPAGDGASRGATARPAAVDPGGHQPGGRPRAARRHRGAQRRRQDDDLLPDPPPLRRARAAAIEIDGTTCERSTSTRWRR